MVCWLAAMPHVLKCMLLSILIQSLTIMVASIRSECNQTRFEELCSMDFGQRLKYLPNEKVETMRELRCISPQRWSYSPDGGPSPSLIDSSYSNYLLKNNTNDTLLLNLTSVSASDEGIYGCLGTNDQMRPKLCVEVYGKAVFASCPHESTCTENETLILPANGGNISFNATVIHINGGNCGYQQNISLIKLKNKTKVIYVYRFDKGYCTTCGENVSFSRGSSGFEFMLTIFNVTADSIGKYYEVIVETKHPGTDAQPVPLTKIYHVVESTATSMLPSTSIATISSSPLSPSSLTPESTKAMTITTSPTAANTIPVDDYQPSASTPPLSVIVGIPIGVLIGALMIVSITAITIVRHRRRKQVTSYQSSDEGSNSSIPVYPAQIEHNQSTMYNTFTMTIAYNHVGNGGTLTHAPDSETSTGQINLPPSSGDTMSTNGEIELSDDQINSNPEMV